LEGRKRAKKRGLFLFPLFDIIDTKLYGFREWERYEIQTME
jgi:hypothetical protein